MKLAAHPAAAVWPMLPADEMQSLADSIADVGLLEPIVRWADTTTGEVMILDGRNRLEACKLAKVTPMFVDYDGDPVSYVLARNESRRHMSKGQRAMAAWMTGQSVSTEWTDVRSIASDSTLGKSQVGMAKVVADCAPDLVPLVIAGSRPLKDAYDEARARRDAANTEEARMDRLPVDLAGQVRDEALSLSEAEAASRQRDQEAVEAQRDSRRLLGRIVELTTPNGHALDDQWVSTWAERIGNISRDEPDLLARLDHTINALRALKEKLS